MLKVHKLYEESSNLRVPLARYLTQLWLSPIQSNPEFIVSPDSILGGFIRRTHYGLVHCNITSIVLDVPLCTTVCMNAHVHLHVRSCVVP